MERIGRLRTLVAGVACALAAGVLTGTAPPASADSPGPYTADSSVKINVMGEWAHPDDDTSIIGPCGVWHFKYGVKCGVIQVTRGEGGGNAVGQEIGPDLGLRRENEDRIAHYRSGTTDIFYIDRVDFFYNQSAPLTQFFWNHEETLRRITRIIRMTQPDVYIGFTPTLRAGHGNHQEAGRFIWEGLLAAADPTMFPEQLTGPDALSTWQVKKVFSGGSTAGTGADPTVENCTAGFVPAEGNLDTVAGVWTGYGSPYLWPTGNIQGVTAGTPKSWQQVHNEGRSAYPTQSRTMYMGNADPACALFGMTDSYVPFQPNINPDGSANPAAGMNDAILGGAMAPDPGGLPLGTLEYLTFSSFYNAPGAPFQATLHVKSGSCTLPAGSVALNVPDGWMVDSPQDIGSVSDSSESTVTFTVTPSDSAPVEQNAKISAVLTTGDMTGYTDDVVRVVPAVEGRFERWGKWAEYDDWLANTAPQASRLGRSDAVQSMGIGQTLTVPVTVHNWSDSAQSGSVSLELPATFTADATTKDYGPLASGGDTTVSFSITNTDTSLPADPNVNIPITTSFSTPSGSGGETLALSLVPTTSIPAAADAPTVDGVADAGEYTGEQLDIGRIWQGADGCANDAGELQPADCGVSTTGDPDHNYAQVTRSDDALYFFIHVRDDYQSYAVTPAECVSHWLADSVEILIDPRGNSSQNLMDTATTFKLGVFPYTNDPDNTNGNGANGPCWERDADNHQGFATGPLAATVDDAPNAPGVEVASSATWVGSNETTVDHAYAGGGYNLEVKIPMTDLPSAVDPDHMGLNITPYDNDNTAAEGTTTLRHIDNSTRLAWSAFGSVQSDPYRWGHATLPGYTPPADRSTTPDTPNVSHPNLDGVLSPQTIQQSAHDGVPISGREPAPADDRVSISQIMIRNNRAEFDVQATGPGTAHLFLWHQGVEGPIPVWTTSCTKEQDPPPDWGLTPCSVTDGGIPPWAPDMSGHVLRQMTLKVQAGKRHISIPLSAIRGAMLPSDATLLASFETPDNEVQAFDIPVPR